KWPDALPLALMMLIHCVRSIHSEVQSALPEPADTPCPLLHPGDWVYIKVHQRKTSLEPRWRGPYQILLTTHTAVKCKGFTSWIHASNLPVTSLQASKGSLDIISGKENKPQHPNTESISLRAIKATLTSCDPPLKPARALACWQRGHKRYKAIIMPFKAQW
uniref:Murine leukemia virus integrase C-terminal domain-containing protein n=1 Tax=Chelydra serpentina TaxID=8475 RepID=A0A8C3THR6_CHESE